MDGSVSTTSVASVRQQFNRQHASSLNGSASDAAIRNALFEQLLSFSVPVQTMPVVTEPIAKPADPVDSGESKSEAVDENQDKEKESDSESNVTTNIPLSLIDPKQPIQPLSDPNTKNDLCSLPPEGKGKAKQDGETADGKVKIEQQDTQIDAAQPATQSVEPLVKAQADQPVADTSVAPVDANAKPVEVDNDHRSRRTDRETTSAVQQTAQVKPEQAVVSDQPKTVENQQKTVSTRPSEVNSQLANSPIQQATESENEDRRERWFERGNESKLATVDQALSKEASSSIDPTLVATDSNKSTIDTKPLETVQIPAAQNTSPALNPSDAVLASAIVQAQSSSTAVKSSAPASTDRTSVQATTDSVNANTTTKSTSESKPDKLVAKENQKTELSQQERVRLVQRIARSFNRISAGGGQINLRLHPEQLGALSVQVNMDGKSMSAQLTTETEDARDIILKELPVLKQRLAEQGYDVTKFQVEVAGQGTEANFGQTSGQTSSEDRDNRSNMGQMDYRRLANQPTLATSSVRTTSPVSLSTSPGVDLLG